ncbi:MAG: aminodeoxychorismate synthase component I [Robiginitomaculum sp.]|nr:aminodeoxychorismate synthase component I [Robiginitomaculum sp.]
MMNGAYVFFEDQLAGRRRLYQNPREIITAHMPGEVEEALARMEACRADGLYLAGYCAYELGYIFEDKLRGLLPENRDDPLLQFGVFDGFTDVKLPILASGHINSLKPSWNFADYKKRFDKVMAWIKAGDVYQVNLTFSLHGTYQGDAAAIYDMLKTAQPVKYGGVVSLARNQDGAEIVSLSPELFFEQDGAKISMRPMKGTVRRGETDAQDRALAKALQHDTKNRAENLMIVDLLRNDLSRLAEAGSVSVTDLFTVETYPSLHTMTSGIEAVIKDAPFAEILRALYPCGSVTGAPKMRAMEVIRALEQTPRGAYCGALGLIDPDGYSRFNVGIRTLKLNPGGTCQYAVGSGVVADSAARGEYEECLLKAAFLQDGFGLIETFGWHKQTGFMWLDLHMARLEKSADMLGFKCARQDIVLALNRAVRNLSGAHKVRLELAKSGAFKIETSTLQIENSEMAWPVAMSKNPVQSGDVLLAHKTTRRHFIDGELRRLKEKTECKEILLFNECGALCEGSYTNVFIVKDGQMLTPPVSCGLLPGILRQVLLRSGQAKEHILGLDDVRAAEKIYIGNSVRGLMEVKLVGMEPQ